jgi:hypothetical protein
MAIGKITSKSLAADAVTSANLAPGAVTISDIPDSEITADKLHTTLDLSTKTLTLTQASVTAHESALTVTQSQISDLSTTSDLAEGTNLYYTDARADARISAATTSDLTEGTNLYYTDARADARAALLVDSAPSTLDTLNELAAALGDDPNFATTVTNSIATKLPLAGGTMTGNIVTGTYGTASTGTGFRFSGSDIYAQTNAQDRIRLNTSGDSWFLGNVGIGETSPLGKLHVKTADSGATADASADELVIEGSGNTGISILSGASNTGSIYFGDSGTNWDGYIAYNQSSRSMTFGVAAGGGTVNINSSGNVGIGTSDGDVTSDGNSSRTYVGIIGSGNRGRLNLGTTAANGADVGVLAFTNGSNTLGSIVMDSNSGVQNSGQMYISTSDDMTIRAISDITYQTTYTNSTAGHHIFKSYNTEIMRIDGANNRVGIGNNNPGYHIDARGGSSTGDGMRVKTGDNGYDGLIVSNSAVLKCYPAQGQSVSLQAYNSGGSTKTGVKVTGFDTPAGEISTKLEFVTEMIGHNVYDSNDYGTSNDQYVDLEEWSPTDFRILEIFGTANPNSGGSGAYADPVHMYVYCGSGWNGAELTYYVYGKSVAPLARDMYNSGSGSSANVAEVWWYNNTTTAQQDAATYGTASGYHLRLKFPNTNTTYGTSINLKVIKRA